LDIADDLHTFNFSTEILTSRELGPGTDGSAAILPSIENTVGEDKQVSILISHKLILEPKGYLTLDYR
jgi:hypothetical protein